MKPLLTYIIDCGPAGASTPANTPGMGNVALPGQFGELGTDGIPTAKAKKQKAKKKKRPVLATESILDSDFANKTGFEKINKITGVFFEKLKKCKATYKYDNGNSRYLDNLCSFQHTKQSKDEHDKVVKITQDLMDGVRKLAKGKPVTQETLKQVPLDSAWCVFADSMYSSNPANQSQSLLVGDGTFTLRLNVTNDLSRADYEWHPSILLEAYASDLNTGIVSPNIPPKLVNWCRYYIIDINEMQAGTLIHHAFRVTDKINTY